MWRVRVTLSFQHDTQRETCLFVINAKYFDECQMKQKKMHTPPPLFPRTLIILCAKSTYS